MNTVKDLREALAEEVRRLQAAPGLESRVLQQALGGPPAYPSRGAASRVAVRSWESHRRARLTTGVRALSALAAVLVIVLIVVGIFIGGRLLRDWGTVPARPPTHAVPRAGPGMVNSTTGWRGGGGRPVQRTTDGGIHWAYAEPSLSLYVASLDDGTYFLDATHAWLTTTEGNGPLTLVTFRTVDGGKTWDRGTDISVAAVGGFHPRLYFLDPTHGWLLLQIVTIGVPASDTPNPDMVEDALYGTSDGGLHWTPLATNLHAENAGCDWVGTSFASLRDGWLAVTCSGPKASQALLSTHDGGTTWLPQELPLAAAGLTCPCGADVPTVFDREDAAILVREKAGPAFLQRLFITADGGMSWSPRTLPGEVQLFVDFIDPKHAWAVAGPSALFERSSSGSFPPLPGATVPLYRTDDGGHTWVRVDTNLQLADANGRLSDLYFVDLQHGFAERVSASGSSQFLRTEDGGRHWAVLR